MKTHFTKRWTAYVDESVGRDAVICGNVAVRCCSCRRVPDYAFPDKIDYNQIRRDDIVSTTQNWHKLSEWEVNVNVSCSEMHQMAVLVQGLLARKVACCLALAVGLGLRLKILPLMADPTALEKQRTS